MKVKGTTYLSHRGYGIEKKNNEEWIEKLKKELTVTPRVNSMMGTTEATSFPVYRENDKKIYLPKNFGLDRFGVPDIIQMEDGDDCPNLIFNGNIRANQEEPVQAFLEAIDDPTKMGGILSLPCGAGKCLAKDTPILMYDGTIKMVQNVKIGDLLMGDDSTPRTVLSTCTGSEEMFDIIPTKGDKYTVNRSHVLSLKCCSDHSKTLKKGTIVDISVDDYLKLPKSYHGRGGVLYGYRVGVNFPTKQVPMDPYLVGYWLGDGVSKKSMISTQESTVLRYVSKLLPQYGMYLQYQSQYDYSMNGNKKEGNPFTKFLHTWNLYGNKHIPHIYKCNSRDIRLQLLAGLIDSDGYYSNKCFEITLKSENLMDDVIYLARSLGFAAYKKVCQKTCTNSKDGPKTGTYYRTNISGVGVEKIPTKVLRKKATSRIQIKDVLMTRITPKSIGLGTYYGFEIDGNRRFLLGDFTVTHNTVIALYLSSQFKKKTMVVCHTQFLMDQWIERIEQYLPKAKTGRIQQQICQTEGKDIVIASLQSLAMRDYDANIFKRFGFVVLDECHHLGAEVFSRCLPKITCKRMLGLSATLKRKDGMSKVFEWYLGKPVFTIKRKDSDVNVLVKRYYDPHPSYSKEAKLWNTGKLNFAKMINQICDFPPRNYMIVQTLKAVLEKEPNRKILILSERRNHLQALEELLRIEKYKSIGYYIGGMSKEQLDNGASEDIILATFQLASEAMDIPKLNTLVLASPVSSIEQPIGRIQRKKKEEREYIPLVIDILDEFSIFERQGAKRIAFYKKNGYAIDDSLKELKEKLTETSVKYQFIQDDDDINK